jgi:hypothetical protein
VKIAFCNLSFPDHCIFIIGTLLNSQSPVAYPFVQRRNHLAGIVFIHPSCSLIVNCVLLMAHLLSCLMVFLVLIFWHIFRNYGDYCWLNRRQMWNHEDGDIKHAMFLHILAVARTNLGLTCRTDTTVNPSEDSFLLLFRC